MASKKKSEIITENEPVIIEENTETIKNTEDVPEKTAPTEEIIEKPVQKTTKKSKKTEETVEKGPKYKIGSIVFVAKDAEADLNGFKLFPQYKKYTYTVEAYDAISEVYSLRRLNLSLSLKEADIVAPHERAHDPINRRQF